MNVRAHDKHVQSSTSRRRPLMSSSTPATKPIATETPPDLIQQQPYIRRALEAFRIPILYY